MILENLITKIKGMCAPTSVHPGAKTCCHELQEKSMQQATATMDKAKKVQERLRRIDS